MTKTLRLLAFVLVGAVAFPLKAQKVAHINSQEILTILPDYKRAQTQLEKYGQNLQNQLSALMDEYKKKLENYQKNAQTMSDALRRDKELEIAQLEERIARFQTQAQEDILTKKQALLEPILRKVNQAIEQVAKEKGYAYVLDISMGTVLYAAPQYDITAAVKRKLGIAPGAGSGAKKGK